MNKHIILTYEGEGSVAGIIQAEYEGTLEELHEVLYNFVAPEDCYYHIEDRMSGLGIKFEYIKHIVDHPDEDMMITE
ncbi:MAG: hypothetical protein ACRC7S_16430 [Cetobacterium sp.]